jgi:hypothetical protein
MACHMRMFRTLPVWPSVEAGESLKSRLRCQMCVLGAPNWVRFGFVFAHCKMRLPLFSMTSSLRSRYFAFLLWISRHPDDKAAYRRISRKAAKAGAHCWFGTQWIPACAGMTSSGVTFRKARPARRSVRLRLPDFLSLQPLHSLVPRTPHGGTLAL